MRVSKESPRPICACGNPRCPLPKLEAILKAARRRPSPFGVLLRRPAPPTLSAA